MIKRETYIDLLAFILILVCVLGLNIQSYPEKDFLKMIGYTTLGVLFRGMVNTSGIKTIASVDKEEDKPNE